MHKRGPFKSGSEVDEEEFLLLKAIWLQAKATDRWRVQTKFGAEHVRLSYFADIETLMLKVSCSSFGGLFRRGGKTN